MSDDNTPDRAFKNAVGNIAVALRNVMALSRLMDERQLAIKLTMLEAELTGKEAVVAIPVEVLDELTALTPFLLFIFEEAPELIETIGAKSNMMEAIAQSKYRPNPATREALTRLFRQVSGVEA